jgi:hypothetical protein
MEECRAMLIKKVNTLDHEKSTKRIETRLSNLIKHICEREGFFDDREPGAVRQPWFCLSCDTEIGNYVGRVGKNVVGDKLAGRKVNP